MPMSRSGVKLIAISFNMQGNGLTRVMHSIMRRLADRHEIHYLGIGHSGETIRDRGLTIYPTNLKGGDIFAAFQAKRQAKSMDEKTMTVISRTFGGRGIGPRDRATWLLEVAPILIAVPILVAFLTSPSAGFWALGYVIVYQQIENYLLSPKLTAKTMDLHPAVAFGAALIGGALGGLLAAFLALPVAGVIQAAVGAWGKRYDVVHDQLTEEAAPHESDEPGVVEKLREAIDKDFGSHRGADHDPDDGRDHGKGDGSDA
jgi:hypothetical protein